MSGKKRDVCSPRVNAAPKDLLQFADSSPDEMKMVNQYCSFFRINLVAEFFRLTTRRSCTVTLVRYLLGFCLVLLQAWASNGSSAATTQINTNDAQISFLFDGGSIYFRVNCGLFGLGAQAFQRSDRELRLVLVRPGTDLHRQFGGNERGNEPLLVGYLAKTDSGSLASEKLKPLIPNGKQKLLREIRHLIENQQTHEESMPAAWSQILAVASALEVTLKRESRPRVWGHDAVEILMSKSSQNDDVPSERGSDQR